MATVISQVFKDVKVYEDLTKPRLNFVRFMQKDARFERVWTREKTFHGIGAKTLNNYCLLIIEQMLEGMSESTTEVTGKRKYQRALELLCNLILIRSNGRLMLGCHKEIMGLLLYKKIFRK